MLDLFFLQTFIITLISLVSISGIFFIKTPQKEIIKFHLIFALCLFFLNYLQPASTNLLLLSFPILLNLKNPNLHKLTYSTLISGLILTNSTVHNLSYLIISNFLITLLYFFLFSKIIFPNQTKSINYRLDNLKWSQINSSQELQDKIQAMTPGPIKNIHISKIDTIEESVYLKVQYEDQ